MIKKWESYRNYLHDLSYIMKDKIDDILDNYDDEDYVMAVSLTYYDIITTMKEAAAAYGVDEKEIALDIINDEEVLTIPRKWRKMQNNENEGVSDSSA